MKEEDINKILKEYKDVFETLEEYDKTGKLRKLKKKQVNPSLR